MTEIHFRVLMALLWDNQDGLLTRHDKLLLLNMDHPEANELLAEAGVSPSRAKRPLFIFFRFVRNPFSPCGSAKDDHRQFRPDPP